jgi:hypothetical protein
MIKEYHKKCLNLPIVVCLFNSKQFEDARDRYTKHKTFCIIQTLANSVDIVANWSTHHGFGKWSWKRSCLLNTIVDHIVLSTLIIAWYGALVDWNLRWRPASMDSDNIILFFGNNIMLKNDVQEKHYIVFWE